jgi:hypothetical protein
MSKNTLTLLLFPVAISLLTLGCDDGKLKTYPVSGIVTMNGEPVARATVIFSPVKEGEGDAATGITNAQGEYKLQTAQGKVDAGTTPGEYVVMIKKTEFFETGKVTTDSSGRTSAVMDSREALPARYKSFSSPLKETVEPKRNTFNFALED